MPPGQRCGMRFQLRANDGCNTFTECQCLQTVLQGSLGGVSVCARKVGNWNPAPVCAANSTAVLHFGHLEEKSAQKH